VEERDTRKTRKEVEERVRYVADTLVANAKNR
jgi:hypothetical protein